VSTTTLLERKLRKNLWRANIGPAYIRWTQGAQAKLEKDGDELGLEFDFVKGLTESLAYQEAERLKDKTVTILCDNHE
jgi:hypothetical protein